MHRIRLTEGEINKIEEVKAIKSKIKNNIEKREKHGEINTIKIESKNEEIFLGFDSDGEAVVLKDYQAIVEQLFQKQKESIEKFDKNPINNH